jgi:hypothetical protein
MEAKKLMAHRYEVSRALRMAHRLSKDESIDVGQAIRDLATALASIALATDQLLEAHEREHALAS